MNKEEKFDKQYKGLNIIDTLVYKMDKNLNRIKFISPIIDNTITNIMSLQKFITDLIRPECFKNEQMYVTQACLNNLRKIQKQKLNGQKEKYYFEHDKIQFLNKNQLDILKQFQNQNQDKQLTNNTFIRYLVARNWNINKAQQMLDDSLKWYKEYETEQLYIEDFPDFLKLGSYYYLGKGKNGSPVVYHDAAVLFPSTFDHQRFTKFFFGCMQNTVRKMEGNIETYITIMDVNGITLQNVDLILASNNISMLEKYYPERIEKFYLLNNNVFTLYLAKLIKHVIPGQTFKKIQFLGKDQQQNLEILQQQIDISNIPSKLGGKSQVI